LLQSYYGMIVVGISIVGILTLFHVACFYRTDEFKQILLYCKQVISAIRSKG